jgi:hypothetical protein
MEVSLVSNLSLHWKQNPFDILNFQVGLGVSISSDMVLFENLNLNIFKKFVLNPRSRFMIMSCHQCPDAKVSNKIMKYVSRGFVRILDSRIWIFKDLIWASRNKSRLGQPTEKSESSRIVIGFGRSPSVPGLPPS